MILASLPGHKSFAEKSYRRRQIRDCALSNGIIELILNEQQTELLRPLIRQAASQRNNVLLLATAAPTIVDGKSAWRFEVVLVPCCNAAKVIKAIRSVEEPQKADVY
jgi:hypothetical protein